MKAKTIAIASVVVLTGVGLVAGSVHMLEEAPEEVSSVPVVAEISDDDEPARAASRSPERVRVSKPLPTFDGDSDKLPGTAPEFGSAEVPDPQYVGGQGVLKKQLPSRFGERNPEKLRTISEEMHVGEPVIAAVLNAEKLVSATYGNQSTPEIRAQAKEAIEGLDGYGVEGFRGVLAMLRTGYQGIWFLELIQATYQPGFEDEMMAVAVDEQVAEFSRWSALRGLQVADTPVVREFLRKYLADHGDDAGLFMSAAQAAGKLGDEESARYVRRKLHKENWSGVRGYLIEALGGMGGDAARDVLVQYIRDKRTEHFGAAFQALAKVDIEAARDEADRFFDSERGKAHKGYDRRQIEAAIK